MKRVVVLVLALAAAACGGSDGSDPDLTEAEATEILEWLDTPEFDKWFDLWLRAPIDITEAGSSERCAQLLDAANTAQVAADYITSARRLVPWSSIRFP